MFVEFADIVTTDLFLYQAFFPILDVEGAHWYLLMLDLCSNVAEIWDSFQSLGRRSARVEKCQKVVCFMF